MRAFCYHVKVFSGTPSYAKEVCRKMESCLGYVLDDQKHLVDFVAQLNSQLKGNPKSKGAGRDQMAILSLVLMVR